MITLEGATCFRRDKTLLIEIPEQTIVDVATKPIAGFEYHAYGFSDRESFLDHVAMGVLNRLYEIDCEPTELREQALHHFVRETCGRVTPTVVDRTERERSEMITLNGARSGRLEGKLVIAIPEITIIDLATKPIPGIADTPLIIDDPESFLTHFATIALERRHIINGVPTKPDEQALHQFIRDVCDRTALWLLEADELDLTHSDGTPSDAHQEKNE